MADKSSHATSPTYIHVRLSMHAIPSDQIRAYKVPLLPRNSDGITIIIITRRKYPFSEDGGGIAKHTVNRPALTTRAHTPKQESYYPHWRL